MCSFGAFSIMGCLSSMEEVFNTLASSAFQGVMFKIAIACLLIALAAIVFSFVFYGRTRETLDRPPENEKWILLFAAWRDSLIITVLFTAQVLVIRYSDFSTIAQKTVENIYLYPPVVQPIVSFVLEVLILIIASARIVAISKWLALQSKRAS